MGHCETLSFYIKSSEGFPHRTDIIKCIDKKPGPGKIPTAFMYSFDYIKTYIFALAGNVFRILALTLVQAGGSARHICQNVLHKGGHTLRLLALWQADVVLRRAWNCRV